MVCHQTPHSFIKHMGVNLGCRNIRMTEHLLNAAQIGIVMQQVGCKCVSQNMGADLTRVESRSPGQVLKHLKEALSAEVFSAPSGKQMG